MRDASGNFVYMTVDGKTADEDGNLLTKTKLDKYDKEGYEYVYVVVETESEGGTTAYEKIFGTVEYDSASGTFKITDKVETGSGEIEEVVYEMCIRDRNHIQTVCRAVYHRRFYQRRTALQRVFRIYEGDGQLREAGEFRDHR